MSAENTEKVDSERVIENKKATSLRIEVDEDILKKVAIIAQVQGFDGKKNEIFTKVADIAIGNYYKEVTLKELQKL